MTELKSLVRPSPIAGRWYEGDPQKLDREIRILLDEAGVEPLPGVIGLVAPHAGHVYSGATAAKAYKAASEEKPETIVIFSPHHAFTRFQCVTSAYGAYATPLGSIEVDHAGIGKLDDFLREKCLQGIHYADADTEHAIEIQLPFLQVMYDQRFKLIPLMLREFSMDELDIFVEGLVEILSTKRFLIISSTDLSHFYPEPTAERLDGRLIEAVGRYSITDTIMALSKDGSEACGATGLLATLAATRKLGGKKVTILGHTTSAQVTGDRSSVVGYLAAAITS